MADTGGPFALNQYGPGDVPKWIGDASGQSYNNDMQDISDYLETLSSADTTIQTNLTTNIQTHNHSGSGSVKVSHDNLLDIVNSGTHGHITSGDAHSHDVSGFVSHDNLLDIVNDGVHGHVTLGDAHVHDVSGIIDHDDLTGRDAPDAHSQYIPYGAAADDASGSFLIGDDEGEFVVKTLPEAKTILGINNVENLDVSGIHATSHPYQIKEIWSRTIGTNMSLVEDTWKFFTTTNDFHEISAPVQAGDIIEVLGMARVTAGNATIGCAIMNGGVAPTINSPTGMVAMFTNAYSGESGNVSFRYTMPPGEYDKVRVYLGVRATASGNTILTSGNFGSIEKYCALSIVVYNKE